MKKILLLCFVCVLCLGSLMAKSTVTLKYSPEIEEKPSFGVLEDAPEFTPATGSITGTDSTKELKNADASHTVYLAWQYRQKAPTATTITVNIISKGQGNLTCEGTAYKVPYSIELSTIKAASASTATTLSGAINTAGGASFSFSNTATDGIFPYEFYGYVELKFTLDTSGVNSSFKNGEYSDTITIKLSTEA